MRRRQQPGVKRFAILVSLLALLPLTVDAAPTLNVERKAKRGTKSAAPGAFAPAGLKKVLSKKTLKALAKLTPVANVELTPAKLADGNVFFLVRGTIVPVAVPKAGLSPAIVTADAPISILYPTTGLAGQSLIVRCYGDLSGKYEVTAGTLERIGDWSSSADLEVQAKGGKIQFSVTTSAVPPGEMLGISIGKVKRAKKGDQIPLKHGLVLTVKEDSYLHESLTITKCTVGQVLPDVDKAPSASRASGRS